MRKFWSLVLFAFMTTGVCAAQVPSLVGNWTGYSTGYVAENGSYKIFEGNISLAIVEQKDRIFKGNVTYTRNGTAIVEGIAGVIGLDNKTLNIAEYNEGYDLGTIISNDKIELVYLVDGSKGEAVIDMFHRITNR